MFVLLTNKMFPSRGTAGTTAAAYGTEKVQRLKQKLHGHMGSHLSSQALVISWTKPHFYSSFANFRIKKQNFKSEISSTLQSGMTEYEIQKKKKRLNKSPYATAAPHDGFVVSPSSAIPEHASSSWSKRDMAQNRRAPILPTSLCSFTKISKYW